MVLPRSAKADMNVYIRTTCRFTCHPCVKRYKHKRKAYLPHTPKCIISAFTCTVNIHVEDVKAHPQGSGSAPEGCCIFIPSLPTDTSPHCYKLYTHQKVVRNSFHCSVSFCQLPKTENVDTMPDSKMRIT